MNQTNAFDPALVMGCSAPQVTQLLRGKPVTPGEAEAAAMTYYPWRRHLHDPESYWVSVSQAADILRIPPQRVKSLLHRNRLPHVVHVSGTRLMRREQIQALADGRRGTPR